MKNGGEWGKVVEAAEERGENMAEPITPQPSSSYPQSAQQASANEQQPAPLPALLLGTFTPKMDAKGRVALPARFRQILNGTFVLSRGQERCIYLLPADEFRRMALKIQQAPLGNKAARDYLRVFLSGAVEETTDNQGRVVIPPMLRTYAKLDKQVAVIGVGTRAEIWDLQTWNEYLAGQEEGYSELADDVLTQVSW